MPTTDAIYQTSLNINGKIDDNLFKGLQKIDTETGKIVKQEKQLETESRKAFQTLEKGMQTATIKGKELAIAMKDMLLPLLGISVAFKGMQTIGDTLQLAIDKFKGAREAAAAFKASIQDVVGIKKTPMWDDFFKGQSEHVLTRFSGKEGPIYGRGITRAAQEAFIQQHVQASNELIQSVIERIVHKQGSLGITPEQVSEMAGKWATFLKLQRGRIPPEMVSELGLTNVKDLAKMSRTQKEALLLREFGGMTDVEQMIRENPKLAELMGVQVQKGKLLGQVGKPLEELQTQGEIISSMLEEAFLPVLKGISEAIGTYLSKPMDLVEEKLRLFLSSMQLVFAPETMTPTTEAGKAAQAYYTNLKGPEGLGIRFRDVWNGVVLPELQADWTGFINWAAAQVKIIGDAFNTMILSLEKAHILPEGTLENLQKILPGIGAAAVGLYNAALELGKISWSAMQDAAVKMGEAAGHLNDAANALQGVLPAITGHVKETETGLQAEYQRLHPGAKPPIIAHAMGGFVNAPQIGLVGEAGKESIIPLARRDATTLDILAGTFSALGMDPANPEAYGHELFDSMRLGAGGFGAGAPGGAGFTGNVGGIFYTEYGPSIDPPGSADYDKNSYNRVGARPGITGRLEPGDVALGYGAQARYGVSPGQTFVDTRGNTVRFADRSGSKNTMNEDIFRLAAGGIVSKRILSWLGDAGKEAVIPLEGTRGKRALQGLAGTSAGHTFHFSPTINVSGVATSEVVDNLVDELRRNFSRWLEDAHFEHERRAFS